MLSQPVEKPGFVRLNEAVQKECKQRGMLRRTFESWMRGVNYWTMQLIGLGRESMPDIDYQCLYASGISARAAAQEAIKGVSHG